MTWQGERAAVPELGLLFPLRRELTEVSYLGLGPRETTADRTTGGKMGAWSYNVRQDFAQNTPVYPQECGSRTGVYSAAPTGRRQQDCRPVCCFPARRWRRQQLGRKAPCGCLLCGGEGHDLLVLHPKAEWIIYKDQRGCCTGFYPCATAPFDFNCMMSLFCLP